MIAPEIMVVEKTTVFSRVGYRTRYIASDTLALVAFASADVAKRTGSEMDVDALAYIHVQAEYLAGSDEVAML